MASTKLTNEAKGLLKKLDKSDSRQIQGLEVELTNIAKSDDSTTQGRLQNAVDRAKKALGKSASLRSRLIRLVSKQAAGSPERKQLAQVLVRTAKAEKQAGEKQAGESLLWDVIDRRALSKLRSSLAKEDPATAQLAKDVTLKLMAELEMDTNTEMALNKLRNHIASGDRWPIEQHRNSLGKIADLLGLRTPLDF